MKNVFKKRIISLIIFCILVSGSIFAQTSITLNAGSVSNIFFYNQNGILIRNIDSSKISFDKTLIIKSGNYKSVFTYKYGNIVLSKRSILVIEFSQDNFKFYLVDGSVDISTNQSASNKISLITPVTEYNIDSDSDLMAYSTKNVETFGLNLGNVIVYNSISGKKYSVHENTKMNLNSSETIAYTDLEKLDSRDSFANMSFPFGIKPIVKSNDSEDFYNLNIIATGNGQGNNGELDFSSFKGLLNEANKYNEKYLLIDAGNTLAGSLYVNFDKGETATKLLDKIGYDVFVPGARDFSYGIAQLKKLDSESNVKFISSNALDYNGFNVLQPYQLYSFNDLRIAIFGLSNPSSLTKLQGLDFNNQVIINNAQIAVDEANKVADYVILVSNFDANSINSNTIVDNISGIDLIINGSQSLAYTSNRNNTLIVSTGVGYSKIINTKLSIYKNNIISVTPSIVHSTNINPNTNNNLSSALNIKSFQKDESINEFFSTIKISDKYSMFLIPPSKENISYVITPNVVEDNILSVPTFKDFVVRKQKAITIINSTKTLEAETKVVPVAPIIIKNSTKITTSKSKIVSTPTFINTKSEILNTEKKADSFEIVATNTEDTTVVDTTVVESTGDKEKYQDIISSNGSSSTSSFGLKTEVDSALIFKDFDFNIKTPVEGKLTLIPYFNSPNFSLALNFNMKYDGSTLVYNSYPYPSINNFENVYAFYMNMLEYLNINSTNGLINFDIKKDNFNSPVESALVLNKLGSNDTLAFTANYEAANSNLSIFLSDATLTPYFKGDDEDAGLFRTSSLTNNMFSLTYGALAKLNKNNIDLYPVLSAKINFVYNAKFEVGLNVNGALYLPVSPFDLTKVINGTNLFPNYIAGGSLNFRFNQLRISAGADYEVHNDLNFSTNIFHESYNRSLLFAPNNTNTISPNVKFSFNNDTTAFSLNYSVPFNLDTMVIANDLLDTSISIQSKDFTYGLYYIQTNLISRIKNFDTLKKFFYNNKVEYGINLGFKLNNYLESTISLGFTDDTTAPLKLSLNVTLNLDKNI
ncbi:MAG: hypothetical protein JJE21_07440 [Spirochaetaceae bacterium]|nr:hypothetical protein [Spirochaetaceae bacterium]